MSKYKLKNEAGSERASLYIYGDIVDDTAASFYEIFGITGVVGPTSFRKALEDVGDKPLDVYISSDGGDVPSGLSIANMLARRTAPTVGHVDGWAASIAGIIFLACTERHMPGNTFLMLHRPWISNFSGNIEDFEKAVDFLQTTGDTMLGFINGRLRDESDKDTVEANYKNEHWYNASEAAEIFDIQIDEDQGYKTVAKCKSYKMPAAMIHAFESVDKAADTKKAAEAALAKSIHLIYGI